MRRRLCGQEVQAQEEMERNWEAVQDWLGELLAERGVDRISAEELTVPPGMDELFSLLQIKRHHDSGEFDAIIVDCAPTGETLRLLSFPDVAAGGSRRCSRWRADDGGRAAVRADDAGHAAAERGRFDDVERLVRNLVAMNGILRDRSAHLDPAGHEPGPDGGQGGDAHVHLPQPLRLPDRRRRGQPRLPRGGREGYFAGWRERQQEQMELVRSAFSPVPILTAPYFEQEVIGPEMLDRLGDELFDGRDAAAVLHEDLAQELTTENGRATLRLPIPFAEKGDIELKKIGLEVVVRVGGQKRTIMLPAALAAYRDRRRALRRRRPRGDVREGRRWKTARRHHLTTRGRRAGRGERRRRERPPRPPPPIARRRPTTPPLTASRARSATGEDGRIPSARRRHRRGGDRTSRPFRAPRRAPPRGAARAQEQFTAFLREALLTLRSLIDWYLERLERRPREPRVEDIPID